MGYICNLVIHGYSDRGGMGYICNLVIHGYSDRGGMGCCSCYPLSSMDTLTEGWGICGSMLSFVTWSSMDTLVTEGVHGVHL